jgi:hypothetical protein
MGEKLRRMVMRRKALCDLVVGATRVQGLEIGGSLGDYLSPVLGEGETLPDLATPLSLYGRKLQGFCDVMVTSDERYLAEIARLDKVEAEVEVPKRRLKDSILSLRDTCRGLIGEESLRPLGLDFNLAQNAQGVLRQAEIIRERVVSSESELMPNRWVEGPLSKETSAGELDADIGELRVAVDRMIEQRKRVDTAKVRKDEALKEFDRNYIPIVRVLEATFRVAGETDLADRIRPTVRQLTRNDDKEQEEQPSEASETPASTSPSPESDAETAASDGQAS